MIAQIKAHRGSGRCDEWESAQTEFEAHLDRQSIDTVAAGILKKYALVEDVAVPTGDELIALFSRFSALSPCPNGCWYLEMPGKTALFTSRSAAWHWYLQRSDVLEAIAASRPVPF